MSGQGYALGLAARGEGSAEDAHRMVYKILDGNGSITAKVETFVNAQELGLETLAKAGLEIRESLAPNSKTAMVYFRGDDSMAFHRRTGTGSLFNYSTPNSSFGVGDWLRLNRNNNTISADASHDGVTWTNNVFSYTLTMNQKVYIGLSQKSRSENDLSIGTYSNISFTGTVGTPAPTYNALTPPNLTSVLRGSGTGTGLTVDWSATSGATGYMVERSIDGTNFEFVAETDSSTTVYVDNTGFGVMWYWYRVSAKTSDGLFSAPSNKRAWINRPSGIDPDGLRSIKYSDAALFLEWDDVAGETGYRLERSSDDGATFPFSVDLDPNVRIYHDTGLTAGTEYVYRIRPLHSSYGNADWTSITTGTRWDGTTNLAVGTVTSSSFQLTWSDVASETGYVIRRSLTGAAHKFDDVGTVGANVTTFTDNTVSAHTEYYYQVQALRGANQTARSFSASAAANVNRKLVMGATLATAALPTGFSIIDLGNNVNSPGSTQDSGGTLSLMSGGLGTSISGTSDNIHFLYKEMTGDLTVVTKVKRMELTHATTAKAGIMVRDTLNADSIAAQTALHGEGLQFGRRTTAGNGGFYANDDETFAFDTDDPDLDIWLKLERTGNSFNSYWSTTGGLGTWTQIGITRTINMTGSVFVGIALAAANESQMSTTTFSDFTIT